MKVGLNLCTLRGRGSSRVGVGVLEGLLATGEQHQYKAFIPSEWKLDVGTGAGIARCKSGMAAKLYAENIVVRRAAKVGEIDRLFSLTDTSTPVCSVPHVLMVQQAYLAYPKSMWPRDASPGFLARMALMHAYFAAGKRSVSMFTVQTESMKTRLASKWHVPEDRIVVVPSAVEIDRRRHASRAQESEDPYLCYVATASPQKNHGILPDVMAALKRRGFEVSMRLTVTKREVPGLVSKAESLGVLDRFEFLGMVDKDAALDLMAGASALFMPSTLESFGLPFYEALALGCPVVAADLGFAQEALGEAGLYAPAHDADAFAARLGEILDSGRFRQGLARAGIDRFARIGVTWNEVARRYLDILEGL